MALEDLTKRMVRIFFQMENGQRLPTIRELSLEMEASIGSIQAVIALLEESGSVTIEKRGHMGSFLQDRSLNQLWAALASDPFIIALPLPSNRRLEGLATALKQILLDSGIDVFQMFVRGSKNRLRTLQQGRCHVAVISGFAAHDADVKNNLIDILLSPYTFILGHKIYISPHADLSKKPLRVLVDVDSTDLQRFTEMEFGDNVEYIPGNFLKLPDLLMTGKGDIMIWEIDEALIHLPSNVESKPLSESLQKKIQLSHTQAALVFHKDDIPVKTILKTYITDKRVRDIQEEVLQGKRVPEY